ncbi:MAG: TAXI family TRAP transporter solute-binding subunit [Chloroflexi bacterium]|nr:TAXI family TRAP transporter solute-binding subunit [Chloroflexota bacterium]
MRKLSMILMALLLSITLIACAKPAPVPAPTVTVTAPAPTVTVTPPAPKPTPTPSVKHEVREVNIYGSALGSTTYVLAFALSDQINKHSEWLRATPIETAGQTENAQVASRTGNRKNSIVNLAMAVFYDVREGRGVFKDKAYTYQIIAGSNPWQNAMVTLDPNIKSYKDLAGKTVAITYPGYTAYTTSMFFFEKFGIKDTVKTASLGYAKTKDSFIDGTIDAGIGALSGFLPKFMPNPALDELMTMKKVYSIPHPLELEAETQRTLGIPLGFKVIPKTADPRMQNDWVVVEGGNAWAVSPEVPEDVILEVLRIIWEYRDEFKAYHAIAEGFNVQGFVDTYAERKSFHPAALKFWEDKGGKITYKEPW